MTIWQWGLIALATLALLGALAALTLAAIKRKARTLAGYASEMKIVCARLIDDPRVSPFDKLKLRALAWYLGCGSTWSLTSFRSSAASTTRSWSRSRSTPR